MQRAQVIPLVQRQVKRVARVSPRLAMWLLDRFPRMDSTGMQAFTVDGQALRDGPRDPGSGENGHPWTHSRRCLASLDEVLSSGEWDSGPGRHTIKFDFDEWVFILEGEVHISAQGRERTLRAGDAALFRAGLPMVWDVPCYVRKVWVQRNSLPAVWVRVARRLGRLVFGRAPGASGSALAPHP